MSSQRSNEFLISYLKFSELMFYSCQRHGGHVFTLDAFRFLPVEYQQSSKGKMTWELLEAWSEKCHDDFHQLAKLVNK